MLVNVNGQICELIKAEAKGGSYHRRVPRKNGKGYTYYYDEDKYAASKNAHLDGPATRSARLTKAVLGAVEGAGKSGCAIKSLRDMAKKEGKEHVAKAIKGCLEKGDLSYKKGMLYRKAMKKAKLELQEKPKEEPKEEKPEKSKRKAMREEPQKKQLKKAEVRLYLDELRKAKGPIGVGKRGGKIYGYDSKGKPIYKPSEVPSKPAKRKPKKSTKPFRYIEGDKVEYTGKTEMLYGKLAHEVVFVEGHRKGKSRVTYHPPEDREEKAVTAPLPKPKKKKPAAPSPQLSLFGQPKLEKPEPEAQKVVQPQAPKVIEPAVEAVSELKSPTPPTSELETKTDPVITDLESRIAATEAVRFKQEQASRRGLDKVVDIANIGREDLPPSFTEQEHAELEKRFDRIPDVGKGWQTLNEPYSPDEEWTQEAAHAKIERMPEGSIIRVTRISGEYNEFKRVAGGKVSIVPKKGEPESVSKVELRIADVLPTVRGLTMAKVEARYPTKAEKVEKLQEIAAAVTEGLPEIPPKPAAPPRVASQNFRSEMQRRSDMHLYPRGNSYPVKDEIKDVGGIWDRNNKLWLLPSQEALDYIHAKMAHANAAMHEEAVKATVEDRAVTGKTYAIREKIKAAGGKWDGANQQWIMPSKEAADEMRELLAKRKSRGTRKKG